MPVKSLRPILAIVFSVLLVTSAQAACDPANTVPNSLRIAPTSNLLFYGDSISAGFLRNDHHFATVLQEILRETYCDFVDFTVEAKGRRGSHYARYQRLIPGILEQQAKSGASVDFLFLQDAGRALRTERPSRPDSKRLFGNAASDTIETARLEAPAITVVVATTPGLDVINARSKFVRLYDRQNDWFDHNTILTDVAVSLSAEILPLRKDTCEAFAATPSRAWTADGVHPEAFGDLALALSIAKYIGVPETDLRLGSLLSLDSSLDESAAALVASSIYSPLGLCP
jgi:hypothetical protein